MLYLLKQTTTEPGNELTGNENPFGDWEPPMAPYDCDTNDKRKCLKP